MSSGSVCYKNLTLLTNIFYTTAQPFNIDSILESLITQLNLTPSLLGDKDIDVTYEIADNVPRFLIGVCIPT